MRKYCPGESDPDQPGHSEPVHRVSRRALGAQHLGAQPARHHRHQGAPRVAGGDLRPLPPPDHPQLQRQLVSEKSLSENLYKPLHVFISLYHQVHLCHQTE